MAPVRRQVNRELGQARAPVTTGAVIFLFTYVLIAGRRPWRRLRFVRRGG
jgi:hypothetical protein